MYSRRFIAFHLHFMVWLIVVIFLVLSELSNIALLLSPIIIIDIWLSISLGLMLLLPKDRNEDNLPQGWTWNQLLVKGYPVRWLSSDVDSDKPLAILIHGWNSRASNMTGRAELFLKNGYNCILFEMRAHGGNQSVQQWAAMHVVHDLEQCLIYFQENGLLKNGFIVHGHSLGGFVAQRALRPSLDTSKFSNGLVLESPVASYEYINNRTCEYLRIPRFLHGIMMKRLLWYYNSMNPDVYSVSSIAMLATPQWGLPNCPTILVQAMNDATLGRKHADLLIKTHEQESTDFEFHIVEELNHAYEKSNTTRDKLIQEWMEENSLLFA